MANISRMTSVNGLRQARFSLRRQVGTAAWATPLRVGPTRYASTSTGSPLDEPPKRTNPAPGAPKPNSPFIIFDRDAKVRQKDRAALRESHEEGGERGQRGSASRTTDYVRMAAAQNLAERVLDIKRQFGTIIELGSGPGYLRHHLEKEGTGVQKIIMCDTSRELLYRDEHLDSHFPFEIERRVLDEEELPFEENSVDCIVSNTSLHWTNDLPGALIQIQRSLKPDGVFVGSLYGGDTLFELRTSLQLAEQEREGGISPRVSPMTDTRDCASLLSRAGFSIPTVDVDEVSVAYPSIYELMHDLRDMGESNAVINRRHVLQRDTLLAAGSIYQALHGDEMDGTVPATFAIIYVIGWKPDESQRKPLERGTASKSMKDVLGSADDPQGTAPSGSGVPPPPKGGQTRSYSTSAGSTSAASSKACPACGAAQPLHALSCSDNSCGHLQPVPSEIDFYQLLLDVDSYSSIPDGGWTLDQASLKNSWRKKQALSHPDRMHSRSQAEQTIAAQQSSLINKAYDTLRDPLYRAHYLLEQKGGKAPGEGESLEDPELLMRVMELREQLEAVEKEDDLEPLRQENDGYFAETAEVLKAAFAKGDLEAAKKAATELRYWSNIQKACREWEPGQRIELKH